MDNACLTILTQGRSQAVANGTFIILPHFAEAAETELLLMAFRQEKSQVGEILLEIGHS